MSFTLCTVWLTLWYRGLDHDYQHCRIASTLVAILGDVSLEPVRLQTRRMTPSPHFAPLGTARSNSAVEFEVVDIVINQDSGEPMQNPVPKK